MADQTYTQADLDAAIEKEVKGLKAKNEELLVKDKRLKKQMEERDQMLEAMKAKASSEEEKRLIEAGDIEGAQRLSTARAMRAKEDQLNELNATNSQLQAQMSTLQIQRLAMEAAINADVRPDATDLLSLDIAAKFQMRDGKPVGMQAGEELLNKNGDPLTMHEYIENLTGTRPYLFNQREGGGALGGRPGAATPNLKTMSMEEKSAYVEKHGQEAYVNLINNAVEKRNESQ